MLENESQRIQVAQQIPDIDINSIVTIQYQQIELSSNFGCFETAVMSNLTRVKAQTGHHSQINAKAALALGTG